MLAAARVDGMWIAIGIGLGVALGVATDQLAMFLAVGVVLGIALERRRRADDAGPEADAGPD